MADCMCANNVFGLKLVKMDDGNNTLGDLKIVEGTIELKKITKAPGCSHHMLIPQSGETNSINDNGDFVTPASGLYLITAFPGTLLPMNATGIFILRSSETLTNWELNKVILRNHVSDTNVATSVSGVIHLQQGDIVSVWCDSSIGTATLTGGSHFSICYLSQMN